MDRRGEQQRGGAGDGSLGVLALASLYPHRGRPHQAAFNRQQFGELARLCRFALVAPLPVGQAWGLFTSPRRPDLDKPPFTLMRPPYLYPPGMLRAWHGSFMTACAWPVAWRLARELGAQVVLGNWLYPDAWAALKLARRLGLPLVAQALGSDLMLAGERTWRRRRVQEVLLGARLVVVKSRPLAKAALKLGLPPERLRLVPNGVDRNLFSARPKKAAREKLDLRPAGRLVLWVGNLVKVKDPALALEALAACPGAELLMAGDGPLMPALRRRCAKLGLEGRVHWLGRVPHRRVADLMAACDALLLSSRSEGDPNVVLEALASGRPVAATRVGGVEDLVRPGENGFLAEPGDAAGLAEALAQVLARDWDPQALAGTVAGRSWSASARRLYEVLAEATEEGA